jgi:hypothetical protein
VIGRKAPVPQPTLPEDAARTSEALERLATVLARVSDDLHTLVHRAQHLRDELAEGSSLTHAMHAEERPLIISRMTELVDDLTGVALAVRRAEARQLRREGASQQQIAEIFGVTRQRVAALLAEPDPAARRPHRPGPRPPS